MDRGQRQRWDDVPGEKDDERRGRMLADRLDSSHEAASIATAAIQRLHRGGMVRVDVPRLGIVTYYG